MLSLTTSSTHLLVSSTSPPHLSPLCLSAPSALFVTYSRTRGRRREITEKQFVPLSSVAEKESGGSVRGFPRRLCGGGCSGFVRRSANWDSEGDFALEAEILEFMKESRNPEAFPRKKELVEAGRMDLVEAIAKRGGWLSLGWDLNDEEEEEKVQENVAARDSDPSSTDKECGIVFDSVANGIRSSEMVSCLSENFSQLASSSGRSLETAEEYESGIEGILNRLEKQRNRTFGIKLKQKGNDIRLESDHGKDDWHSGTSMDTTVAGLESSKLTSVSSNKHIHNDLGGNPGNDKTFFDVDGLRNSLNPNTWRTWSIQRAGFSDASFEAAEIATIETRTEGPMDGTRDEILEAHESSSDELQNLSDAWEFQENEIMNAQGRLRSIRAKLAVLEGKMAIAIIDAQKMVEEKQKRIDDARIAFRLLRATCVVWPSSASEVLLAGSFDGWATQV
ncbi:hypothetical protein CJ030_MR3G002943 [Morella rubra]|uniref:Uncharacterized protein n=1 Tax=Morella rubra TaxID=262757 RepID=A0A6A1W656_9ROSI|nr:hypothetical protein CJ030_MR3G002943 [Morella rubra]